MKISTNLTEIKELFAHRLGIDVSELGLTIESENVPAASNEDDDGWIINTNTTERYPDTLKANDYIEVEYSDGCHDRNIAEEWGYYWNSNNINPIVKYRKVNK